MATKILTTSERYLNFSLGDEEFAIPLLSVREVIAVPETTPIPHSPGYFLGIMNLRGQIITILDLRVKLGIKAVAKEENAVIICELMGLCIGIVVDSVNCVLAPRPEEISDHPEIHNSKASEFITAVFRKDKKLILFIDLAKSLGFEDISVAKTQLEKAA